MLPGVPSGDRDESHACFVKKAQINTIQSFSRMGPSTILLLERVDYFGTREYFSGRKKESQLANFDGEANWSSVSNFCSMQTYLVSFLI